MNENTTETEKPEKQNYWNSDGRQKRRINDKCHWGNELTHSKNCVFVLFSVNAIKAKKKLSTNSKSLEFTVLQSESCSCSLCQTLLNLMLCSQCWSWAMFYSRMCSTKIITLKIPFKVLPPLFILEWKSMIRLNDLNERWFRTYIGKNIRTDGSRDRWI